MPTWVGDVVMATPFTQSLFQRFPDARIELLMYRHLHAVLQGSPWVQDCHFWPKKQDDKAAYRAEYKLFVQSLRARRFQLAVLLPNSIRVAWLAFRIGARRRVGYNRDGRGLLLTDRLAVPNKSSEGYTPMPLVDYYSGLAEFIGCAASGDQLRLYTTAADEEETRQRLQQAGIDDPARVVVVCPGANFGASKCWPPERFAAVADRLAGTRQMQVVISPGPGEEPLAQAIQDAMQQPSTLLDNPCLTLGGLKWLIANSALLLGNDTGPRHFARAFDTPRVTVFGPTEARWTHTSHQAESIVRVDVPCGPCHKKVCPLPRQVCMDNVTVDMVHDACERQLTAAG